jgi:hypothetical protein
MIQFTVVLFDNLPEHAKHLKTRLLDLAEFKARGSFDIAVSNDLDTDLKKLSNDYEYAVVIALGSIWHTNREIVDSVQYAKEKDAPLIAHIIDRKTCYECYEFHPQWFVLNLQVYKELLFPRLATDTGTTDIEVLNVIRSEENFHHNYTPHWIKPGTGHQLKSIPNTLFGFRLINQLLNSGYTIYNVPQHIRDRKSFCYPEHNVDEIYKSMENTDYASPIIDAHFDWLVRGQRQNVYNGVGYYPANTEPTLCYNQGEMPNIKFNYFAGVAGGFKAALLTNTNAFSDTVRIVIFDYSDAALNWQKHLYNSWDGDIENLEGVFNNFRDIYPNYNPIMALNKPFVEKIKDILQEQGTTIDELSIAWKKYKDQAVEFRKIDLLDLSSTDTFTNDLQDTNTCAYLWFSNVFYMDWQMFYYGKEEMSKKQQSYYNELKNKSKSAIVIEHCNILQVVRPSN